ncbi:hypothetical protein D3C76_1600990 [compost metagenome]
MLSMNMYSTGNTMISPTVKMAMEMTQSRIEVDWAKPARPIMNILSPAASHRFRCL